MEKLCSSHVAFLEFHGSPWQITVNSAVYSKKINSSIQNIQYIIVIC